MDSDVSQTFRKEGQEQSGIGPNVISESEEEGACMATMITESPSLGTDGYL